MRLKLLREHYQSKDNRTWTPKRSFNSDDEIKEELGFDPDRTNSYRCTICGNLHVESKK